MSRSDTPRALRAADDPDSVHDHLLLFVAQLIRNCCHHPRLLHPPHSSASTAMACSIWMPTIGRAGTDPRSQDADTDNARSVTSDRSKQIDTGRYVLPSQSTWGATSTGPQAVTTIPNEAARQREAMATSRILPRPRPRS